MDIIDDHVDPTLAVAHRLLGPDVCGGRKAVERQADVEIV